MRFGYRAAAVAISALILGGVALARGPDMGLPLNIVTFDPAPSAQAEAPMPDAAKPRAHASFGSGQPVCVRLCDGYFVPTASAMGGEAACAAQCPDAPTALYRMVGDQIDDAVSPSGARYSKLPVAKRYLTVHDATCACHRDSVISREREILNDPTLRRGDIVMTAEGFRVFEGGGYGPATKSDFVALSQAANIPRGERAELAAMERAKAGSPARAAPVVVERPKGRVTVENAP